MIIFIDNFLQTLALVVLLATLFLLLNVFHFFGEYTFTVTMHLGPVAVFAQVLGDVFLVYFKTGYHKKTLKMGSDERKKEQYGQRAAKHSAAKVRPGVWISDF